MTDYEYRPTGELRLLVCRGDGWGPMFTLSDGETLLEDRLNEVVIKLLQEIQKSRHQEIRNRQEAIEREAAERVRRKAEEKQRKERERQKHFLTAATDWARCVELRQYIEAVREEATQRSGPKLSHELNAWLDWANGYVDTLSPLARDRPLPRIDSSDVRGNPTDETND
ncbi:hypothetical protein ACYFX5_11675 [Bremerella sp. T1]|uniref:hypothetical protein n=1 Tax=Bremerella sp. TYQ1 TaxID=3119568 RepID=UPI001CCA2A39|nr:hypothetical protein [Bremerella volcania]UBM33732.1 hypothetical protein LA756_13620 [Bremerella volcania]